MMGRLGSDDAWQYLVHYRQRSNRSVIWLISGWFFLRDQCRLASCQPIWTIVTWTIHLSNATATLGWRVVSLSHQKLWSFPNPVLFQFENLDLADSISFVVISLPWCYWWRFCIPAAMPRLYCIIFCSHLAASITLLCLPWLVGPWWWFGSPVVHQKVLIVCL